MTDSTRVHKRILFFIWVYFFSLCYLFRKRNHLK